MKAFKLAIIIGCALCPTLAGAQTFLDRLQTSTAAQGSVSVTQSQTISDLVNWAKVEEGFSNSSSAVKPSASGVQAADKDSSADRNADSTSLDPNRKKVMGKGQKVDGYRIQAYAGGNTKADQKKADEIGEKIKQAFPDEPIYVHFYSPRWTCRVGNYRTYEEANTMLEAIKELGISQATILKGKITVQY